MSGRVELINADIVMARLQAIPQKIREAVERKALVEANKLAVGRLRENTPTETGALKRSFVYDIRRYKGGNLLVGIVGADYNYVGTVDRQKKFRRNDSPETNKYFNPFNQRRRPAKYLHLVELGTGERKTKDGKKRGSVPATHFRETTAQDIAPQVQQILENAIQEALQ